jgi:sortase B
MEKAKQKQYAHLYETPGNITPFPGTEELDAEYDFDFDFSAGDLEKSHTYRHRRTVEKVCKRIAVSFLAMAVVLLSVLLHFQIKQAKSTAVLSYIQQEREVLKKLHENGGVDTNGVAILSEYAILYNMYPNLRGWLTVDGTPIDYPVMQDTSGGDYYLTHDFEGKEDNRGALFVSADTTLEPLDKNIVVFGHNISDGTQFGELDRYLDYDFYTAHPTITFDTIYETGTYQIVAVVKTHVKTETEGGFRYYWSHGYEDQTEFQELVDFIGENSIYDTGEYLTYGDTTLMLSTCEYTVDNGRLVVIAKKM